MNLVDALVMVSNEQNKASQPCDMEIGTVSSVKPLTVERDIAQAPLNEAVLILTESVIEKKIPILDHIHHINSLGHSHSCPDGGTSTDLTGSYPTLKSLVSEGANGDQTQDIICYEHGKPLPIKDGQKFIILSRIFEVN